LPHVGLSKAKHAIVIARFLQQAGARAERLLDRAKLPPACLERPELLVPTFRIRAFREIAADHIALPNIVLEATESLSFSHLGDFGRAITRTPTLYRSLVEFCTLVNTESSSAAAKLVQENNNVWFCHHQFEKRTSEWNSDLYMLIWMLRTVRLSAPKWSPDQLQIGFKKTPERLAATKALGCENARFGAKQTSFAIPKSMLATAMQVENGSNPANGEVGTQRMIATAPALSFNDSLMQVIESYQEKPWVGIQRVAEIAGVSTRTLQRRLEGEGLSYSTFVDNARFESAISLLENSTTSLPDIAMHLGYSNHPNFTRAFQRWAGVSPIEFRVQRSVQNRDAPWS